MTIQKATAVEDRTLQRVCSEFLEMPGMRLTAQQAQRLWGLDTQTCQALLEFLVDAKFLCRHAHGTYSRLSDGFVEAPRPRMARATGRSPMVIMDDDLAMAAAGQVPVLITCESPTRRERCARLIHHRRYGADRPFITFHGDAPLRRRFEEARGGTLFINDIAGLTADAQLDLLSLIDAESRERRERAVRIVAGASRCVAEERRSGEFSDQLFYRLNLIHLNYDAETVRKGEMATLRQARSR